MVEFYYFTYHNSPMIQVYLGKLFSIMLARIHKVQLLKDYCKEFFLD
ncbi:hypothetical protein A1OE_839 [Candidatus Endolissoclinum faulkneri L2]|uniref:Uncharacterized protein n=1 Tax=Candidatus Endolissoclinum faulkneri L2 TaxID=1193729 RepID=K7YR71_9PROT|nr:hypothetical protein A1OE_839 [Candidatus Endolissoclinum faulkneri L2]